MGFGLCLPALSQSSWDRLLRRPPVSLRATPSCPTLTITAPLHLPDAVQGVSDEVWEAPVEVHRSQAALKAIPRGHQLGQVAEHILAQTTDVQLPCKGSGVNTPPSFPPAQDADILPLGPPRHLRGSRGIPNRRSEPQIPHQHHLFLFLFPSPSVCSPPSEARCLG